MEHRSSPLESSARVASEATTRHASTLPIAPSLAPTLRALGTSRETAGRGHRTVWIAVLATAIGVVAAFVAQFLTAAINGITNLAFHGTLSLTESSPADNTLGLLVVVVPIIGALIVGIMARYGSPAIRGHGIPEAMEHVLFNESRIPARVFFLKPVSAVISIGTGGPFGAEGPIIATGGALGSLFGQYVRISADERKTLLAAGAAAGMAATFGAPVSAVLLAIELLLFEYRPQSLVPVALAAAAADGVRIAFVGDAAVFNVGHLPSPEPSALLGYVVIGVVAGLAAVAITKAVYAVEDAFEHIPFHWMWWPAIGAVAVGVIGYFVPRTLGVGYENIEQTLTGELTGTALAVICAFKLLSWLFSLGSGTSGGTLAPLFTVGGGLGAGVAVALGIAFPSMGIDDRVGALVGMAALFAGASRAPLACVVFAFEATGQPVSLLPLLAGCSSAHLTSNLLMDNSIMTEKLSRRGRPVPQTYAADQLERVLVRDVALRDVVTLRGSDTVAAVRERLDADGESTRHHGYPVLLDNGELAGVVTRTDVVACTQPDRKLCSIVTRSPLSIEPDASLRAAADIMLTESVGRLPVVQHGRLVGILTRSDLLAAHAPRLAAAKRQPPARGLLWKRRPPGA